MEDSEELADYARRIDFSRGFVPLQIVTAVRGI